VTLECLIRIHADQSKIEATAIPSNTKDFLFVVLTCVAGSVDVLSGFGLGGVFTSFLPGNTIVLAPYLVQSTGDTLTQMRVVDTLIGIDISLVVSIIIARHRSLSTTVWQV
jgi:uncharacterized membrane protein YoaK (UPF0700 family)